MLGLDTVKVCATEVATKNYFLFLNKIMCGHQNKCLNNFLESIEQHWQYLLHVVCFLSLSLTHPLPRRRN